MAKRFSFLTSFIFFAVRLTTDPQPHLKRVLQRLRSVASSFNFQHPFISLSLSISCVCLLPRLPVTSFLNFFFFQHVLDAVTRCDQSNQPCSFVLYVGHSFTSWLVSNTSIFFSHDRSKWSSPSFSSITFHNLPGISYLLSSVQFSAPYKTMLQM